MITLDVPTLTLSTLIGEDFTFEDQRKGLAATMSIFETVGDIDLRATSADGAVTNMSFRPTIELAERILEAAKVAAIWDARQELHLPTEGE